MWWLKLYTARPKVGSLNPELYLVLVLSLSLLISVCLQVASLYFCGFFLFISVDMGCVFSHEDTTQIPRDSFLG